MVSIEQFCLSQRQTAQMELENGRLASQLKEVVGMNTRWQRYDEQREAYVLKLHAANKELLGKLNALQKTHSELRLLKEQTSPEKLQRKRPHLLKDPAAKASNRNAPMCALDAKFARKEKEMATLTDQRSEAKKRKDEEERIALFKARITGDSLGMKGSSPMGWMVLLLVQLCFLCAFVQASAAEPVYLERGGRGSVSCPLIKSHHILSDEVEALFWYYDSLSSESMLISSVNGNVFPPPIGVPEGVYDIDDKFNLVIENITGSNEGTYYCEVKLHDQVLTTGQVEVCDKVSPSPPYPTVIGCNPDHDEATCEAPVYDSMALNLTCVMEQVKPVVELRWIRLFLGGQMELNAFTTVRPVVLPAYLGSMRNNTFSTSASVQVAAVDDKEVYVCEATGVAVGRGTSMSVRFKVHHTTESHYETHSDNPGTPPILAVKVEPTANKPAVVLNGIALIHVFLIVLVILVLISVILTLLMFVYAIYQKRKRNEDKRKGEAYKQVPSSPGPSKGHEVSYV